MAQAANMLSTNPDPQLDAAFSIPLTKDPVKPNENVKPSAYFAQKDLLERALAAIMLIPCSLVILFMVFLVRITSRGPGIYRQERVGRNGQIFTMYKIRTMRANAEENTGAVWSPRSDPRITRVGRILRRLHLDEFPQIYNVLRGDMSLIGPRPERPEFVDILEKKVPGYSLRHSVKPGITGLAQINLPPDVNLSCVRRKLTLDLEYIMTANLSLDARMFLCSGFALLGIPGHFCKRAMNIKRTVQLPVAQETKEPDQRDAA